MRVMIFGAGGMLGRDLQEAFSHEEVLAFTRAEANITNLETVSRLINEAQPSVIINAAAFTRVDDCESMRDEAYLHNAFGPRNLAVAAQETGAALVQISTDYVFAGTACEPYKEYDETGPASVYGKSKLAGERMVEELCQRHYIVRTSWLYGLHGKNFVETMLNLARDRERVTVVDDQRGAPTFTSDLARALVGLVSTGAYGMYHLTNQGSCTWNQFARDIFELSGRSDIQVDPISTEALNRPAPRPRYSVLDNMMWRFAGLPPLRHYRDALEDYLSRRGQERQREERP